MDAAEGKEYRLFDHTADLGVEIRAVSLDALFVAAGRALFDLIGTLPTTEARRHEIVDLAAECTEDLFRSWLAELLFRLSARGRVFSEFEILELDSRHVKAKVGGEEYDPRKHSFDREIKAVTFHGLEVSERPGGWRATVIFDI